MLCPSGWFHLSQQNTLHIPVLLVQAIRNEYQARLPFKENKSFSLHGPRLKVPAPVHKSEVLLLSHDIAGALAVLYLFVHLSITKYENNHHILGVAIV